MLVGFRKLTIPLCLCMLLWPGLSIQASPQGPRFNPRTFTTADGLPANQVTALLQTSDRFLWVGTRFGLVRLDGHEVQHFNQANTHELAATSETITGLCEEGGGLWITTARGIVRMGNGLRSSVTRKEGLPSLNILAVTRRSRGGIWIGTHSGAGWISAAGTNIVVEKVAVVENVPVDAILETRDGAVWFGVRSRLLRWIPGEAKAETVHVCHGGRYVSELIEDKAGRVWFTETRNGQLFVADSSTARPWPLPEDGAGSGGSITALGILDGELLFARGTDGDIYRLAGSNFVHYARTGAKVAVLRRDGNAWWVGTGNAGVLRLSPRAFHSLASGNPRLDHVYSIAAGTNGQMWLGTEGGAVRVEGDKSERVRFEGNRDQVMSVHSIFVDRERSVWAARGGVGVWKLAGGLFRHQFPTAAVPPNWRVWAIAQDPEGGMWFGSDNGVFRQSGSDLVRVGAEHGLVEKDVRAIAFGPNGALWVGTYRHGLWRLAGDRLTIYNVANGLANNEVHVLRFDRAGRLWVGTQNGLSLYADDRWFTFTTAHGLFDNVFNEIQEDATGRMWFACNRGVYWMEQKELLEVAAGRRPRAGHVAYGERDGMATSETTGEYQPSSAIDAGGCFWFPTARGVAQIDPLDAPPRARVPAVFIEAVVADGEAFFNGRWARPLDTLRAERSGTPITDKVRLRPGQNRYIEFSYAAPVFDAPEAVRFEYKLEGQDRSWIRAGSHRSAFYANLRPGTYRFLVRAWHSGGTGEESSAVLGLRVPPRFFQTWWFRAVVGATCLGLIVAFVIGRMRVRQRMLDLEHVAALEQQRSRIAQDMHDELGAGLTKIAILSEVAKRELPEPGRAGAQIDAISETARDVVDGLAEIVWTVNPANDTLDTLCAYIREHAGEFFERTGVECEFDIPLQLPATMVTAEFRRNIFYSAKEIMTNAARHSKAGRVAVRIRLEEEAGVQMFRIQISDDGRGFDAGSIPPFRQGLANIRKRIHALAGTVEWHSNVPHGTRVLIAVPLVLKVEAQTR
jgi:ligand-binding sensor domain-containing protein/signal transduction histidine kinase